MTKKKALLFIIPLILMGIIVFTLKNTTFSNAINQQEKLGGDELEDDNWELSTVFYDSTVNNGNTPLTEINWNALTYTERREIRIQINYKNTNAINQYNPNELRIEIEKLRDYKDYIAPSAISAGAANSGYEWNYQNENPLLVFKNNNTIEQRANLEGSIQITYVLDPVVLVNNYSKEFKATLKYGDKELESNNITFNFVSTKKNHTIGITPEKLKNFDGLPDDFDNYIWVKWKLGIRSDDTNIRRVRFIAPNNWAYRSAWNNINSVYTINHVPTNAIVLDNTMLPLENTNGNIKITLLQDTSSGAERYYYLKNEFYVGYPKSEYSDSTITNTVDAYGDYWDEDDTSLLVSGEKEINSNDYLFNGTGNNTYTFTMGGSTSLNGSISISRLKAGYASSTNEGMYLYTGYNGTPYNVEIIDDTVMVPDGGNYRILNDNEYYMRGFNYYGASAKNANGAIIKNYDMHIYVRHANSSNYELYSDSNGNTTFAANANKSISFTGTDIVAFKIKIENVKETISHNVSGAGIIRSNHVAVKTSNIELSSLATDSWVINSGYLKVYDNNGNNMIPPIEDYENIEVNTKKANQSFFASEEMTLIKQLLLEKDQNEDGINKKRAISANLLVDSIVKCGPVIGFTPNFNSDNQMVDYPTEEKFKTTFKPYTRISVVNGMTKSFKGIKQYMLLPEGMQYEKFEYAPENISVKTKSGLAVTSTFLNEHTTVDIRNNYMNSNRTLIIITHDFTDDPIDLTTYTSDNLPLSHKVTVSVPYDAYFEFGGNWKIGYYVDLIGRKDADFEWRHYDNGKDEETGGQQEPYDFNGNNVLDKYFYGSGNFKIVSAVSTNQDVQTSVQSSISNFSTGKVNVGFANEYIYKLRARTGSSEVTNLIIYNSLENYTKDSNQNFINANGIMGHWQGEFLGIDTTYAESKGYNVKVYYSEEVQPGKLKEDTSWQEYTDSVDKTKVKSLAFEYLDSQGNPAVLPANSSTYVLINMRSPSEEFKTFAYNGCWTEWNAIDPVTGDFIDFITGINSNIVKVSLPSSREQEDMEITLTKNWDDNSNSLGMRPSTVTYRLIPNNDYSNAQEVTFSGSGKTWTYNVTVPKYDTNGENIIYTIKEDTINLENNYKYVPEVDNLSINNTLYKNIIVTKNWLDNNNAYLTRPSNVTIKVYQNGNYYKDINITGTYNNNTWTGSLSVPVFADNGTEYTYTVDEISINNYQTTCTNLVCTNLLVGEDTININKVWNDNNNAYNTRPSSLNIKLKQNGNEYQTITLNNNWSKQVTVPKYDSNGVKYNYTIEETPIDEYGLVTYNQGEYQVTNSLKKNINITITKKWVDDNNSLGLRPSSLKITLLQNGNEYQELTLSGTTNTWTTTVEVPKYDDNQKLIKYTIQELNDDIKDEYSNVFYSEEELSVTNTLNRLRNLEIKKIWNDHNNDYKTRPEKITLKVLQNGEEYKEIELTGTTNEWVSVIEGVPTYDSNGVKYNYTIKEIEENSIERYENITYDQTTLTVTNELTEIPTVTLYFTVINGYTLDGENILFDDDGLRNILKDYELDPNDEYLYTFELKNVDTGKIFTGKLSTKGVLEFKDIEYGTYRAVEKADRYFAFAHMLEIQSVLGVKFTPDESGGTITISPTGSNIIYGTNVINMIKPLEHTPEPENPKTKSLNIFVTLLILLISLISIVSLYIFLNKKQIIK